MSQPRHADIPNYRPDIDGLRGIAIIAAICFHAGIPGAAGGFAGIEIFFVVSGFVITHMILAQQASGKFDLRRFYSRRVLRLIPATIPVLFVTTAFSAILMSQQEFSTYFKSVISMVLFYANFFFYFYSNYFQPQAETQPLLHSWSLSVEEQFYLLWPVAMMIAARLLRPRATVALIVISLLASAILLLWLHPSRTNAAFYMLPPRMWEFFVGILLAYLKPVKISEWIRNLLSATGLATLLGFLVWIRSTGGYPNASTAIPVLATALIIASGDMPEGQGDKQAYVNRLLGAKWLVWMGLISYSLYLWHWPILTLVRIAELNHISGAMRGALVLTAVPVAWLSYRLVEVPWRAKASRPEAGRIAAVVALVAVSFSILTAGLAQQANALWTTEPAIAAALAQKDRLVEGNGVCHGWSVYEPIPACRTAPAKAANGEWLLIGDSHADAIAQSLAKSLNSQGIALTLLSQSSCPTGLDFEVYIAQLNIQTDYCARANRRIIDEVLGTRDIDTLVIASHWPFYVGTELWPEQPGFLVNKGRRVSQEDRLLAFIQNVQLTHGANMRIVLMGPTPLPGYDVPVCADRSLRLGRSTSRCFEQAKSRNNRILAPTKAMIERVGKKTGAIIVESESPFCDTQRCLFGRSDEIWWYDDRHLSKAGSARLSASFLAQMGLLSRK